MSTKIGNGPSPTGPWLPSDDGFLGATADPAGASGGGLLIAGTLYLARLPARTGTLITNLFFGVSVAGAGASTGSFEGLYSANGILLSGSADIGAKLTGATGWPLQALNTPQSVSGFVYAAILCNLATTQVTLVRSFNTPNASPQAVANAATMRWGSFPAVGTALPASVIMANMAQTSFTNVVLWS